MHYIKGKGYFESSGAKAGSKRQMDIARARAYGAEGDLASFTQLRIESRVAASVLVESYRSGQRAIQATTVPSADTRIVPASREHKVQEITKGTDGSLHLKFGNGSTGTLDATDRELQAFAVWTMLNSECTT